MPEAMHDWSFVLAGYALVVVVVGTFVAGSYRRIRRMRRAYPEER
jgi:hypothetical protein